LGNVLKNKSMVRLTPEFKGSCSRVKITSEKTIFVCSFGSKHDNNFFKCHFKENHCHLGYCGGQYSMSLPSQILLEPIGGTRNGSSQKGLSKFIPIL
jgi:hypothetical protein